MTEEPPGGSPSEPSLAWLIVKGLLMVLAAFFSANVILVLHTPAGH